MSKATLNATLKATSKKTLSKALRIVLTLIGSVIAIDCAVLIAFGKVNFGTVVPFLIGIIFIIHGIYWQRVRRFVTNKRGLTIFWYVLWGGFIIWLISFIIFVVVLKQQISESRAVLPKVKAVIVLGSGTVDGKPTPTLAKRLDASVPIINANPDAVAITSGGVGLGRSRSEADIMATYLANAHNISMSHIVQEGKSTSTEENLANSHIILQQNKVTLAEPIAIVTSDFHTIRAKAIAHRQGYQQPIMVASSTPVSIRYNAWFREYFAFVSGWLLDEY